MNPVTDWFLFVLASLASYRLTRLVVKDAITLPLVQPVREWFEYRWIAKRFTPGSVAEAAALETPEWNSRVAYLLACHWCLGFWVSGAVTVVLSLVTAVEYPVIVWLAMACATGLIGEMERDGR